MGALQGSCSDQPAALTPTAPESLCDALRAINPSPIRTAASSGTAESVISMVPLVRNKPPSFKHTDSLPSESAQQNRRLSTPLTMSL